MAAKARVAVRTNGRTYMAAMAQSGLGLACLRRFVGTIAFSTSALERMARALGPVAGE